MVKEARSRASSPAEASSRRQDVIEATIRVIGRKGLAGTSIRAIAHELGFTLGVVTHHFQDKSELLCAALETCFQPWERTVQASKALANPAERLRFLMFSTLASSGHPTAQMQTWLEMLSQIDLDERVANAYRIQYQQTREDIVDVLKQCQQQGYIAADLDVVDEACRLLSLSDGLLVSNTGDPGFYTEDRMKRIMSLQLDALVRPFAATRAT